MSPRIRFTLTNRNYDRERTVNVYQKWFDVPRDGAWHRIGFDIEIEADLLEELVRIHGYNNIPRTQPKYHAAMREMPERPRMRGPGMGPGMMGPGMMGPDAMGQGGGPGSMGPGYGYGANPYYAPQNFWDPNQ